MDSSMFHTTARRTTLRAGAAAEYVRKHASIPPAVDRSLREAGVVAWTIWRDGDRLFHVISTRGTYPRMLEAIAALPPVDPEWDAMISALLDPSPGADELLDRVWTLEPHDGAR